MDTIIEGGWFSCWKSISSQKLIKSVHPLYRKKKARRAHTGVLCRGHVPCCARHDTKASKQASSSMILEIILVTTRTLAS